MSINVCAVTGTLLDLNGAPIVNATVRAGAYSQPLLDNDNGIGFASNFIETFSTSTGTFSINLPQGMVMWLSIPSIGYRNDVTVPTQSTTVFTAITPSDGTY
jgi:hypothetical protein